MGSNQQNWIPTNIFQLYNIQILHVNKILHVARRWSPPLKCSVMHNTVVRPWSYPLTLIIVSSRILYIKLIFYCFAAVNSGDTIGLQTYDRTLWLSCSGPSCSRHPCPRMYMTGGDWTACWGEVFRIYRAAGSGHVRAGDIVGFYYPYQPGFWLGCAGANCAKSDCPGSPTTAHGFASEDHWVRCWGEVFRIYANGKSSGTVINSGDDIMLYYIQGDTWVSQGNGNTRKLPCPGSVRPPAFDKFDGCGWETFKIWKR